MISVAVMAHRKREHFVPQLLERLDADPEVVWDRENDRWETGRRALLAHDPDATHHLVVQDDAVPCRDLVAGVREALTHIPPESPLALYMGRVRPSQRVVTKMIERARRRRASFVRMEGPWWGVAIAIPTPAIEDAVAWGDGHPRIPNYDRRLSRFFSHEKVACYYTIPSLVEHRHGPENPSLVAGRTSRSRRAWRFHGEDRSALELSWEGGVVSPTDDEHGVMDDIGPIEVSSQFGTATVDPRIWDLLTEGVLVEQSGDVLLVSRSYYEGVHKPRHGRSTA